MALNVVYVAAEAGFGLWAKSLALLADAGHNLSDVAGLLLAWGAVVLARKRATARHTYGWRRASVLAALGNGLLLFGAVGAIVWEAVGRFQSPEPISGGAVMAVAAVGIGVNAATAMLFAAGSKDDLNVRGAWLHMVGDALVSLAVVIAGVLIYFTGALWIDPLMSLLVAAVIAWSTWGLAREALNLAMDAVPAHIDENAIRAYLQELPGVCEVHDLHIWALGTNQAALTAHLLRPEADAAQNDALLHDATHGLEAFGIAHTTLQIESKDNCHGCACA